MKKIWWILSAIAPAGFLGWLIDQMLHEQIYLISWPTVIVSAIITSLVAALFLALALKM